MIKTKLRLTSLIERVATRIINDTHPYVEEDIQHYMESHIDVVYPLLDKLCNLAVTPHINHFTQATLVLISEILGYTNYHLEQKRRWTTNFIAECQSHIVKHVLAGHIGCSILQYLFDILRHSDIPINDALRQANTVLLDEYADKSSITVKDIGSLWEEISSVTNGSSYEMKGEH